MEALDYWVLNRAHHNIFHNLSNIGQKPPPSRHRLNSKRREVNHDNMNTKRIPAHQSRSPQPASGYRNPWYERPSDVGGLSEQFFDSRVSPLKVCPETALMYAVLEDAFLCFQKKFETERRFMQRAREAERWFFSDASRWLFSFVSVCDALGLEPEYIRKKLKHWTPTRLDRAQATR
jgi:hypothetical protein